MKSNKVVPYIMIAPYLIHFLVFISFPVLFSFFLMFNQWNIISPMKFIGLQNFYKLIHDAQFFRSLLNTLIFLVIHIPLQIIVALFFATMLNQKIRFIGFFRAAYFLPVIVSGVVITILWQQLYGYETGLLNRILTGVGIPKNWLAYKPQHCYGLYCNNGYLEKCGIIYSPFPCWFADSSPISL